VVQKLAPVSNRTFDSRSSSMASSLLGVYLHV
jgi:hypothetical protein